MSFIKSPRPRSSRRAGALIEGKQQNGRLVVFSSPRADGPDDIRQNKLLESLVGSKLRIIHLANKNLVPRNRAVTLMCEADAKPTNVLCTKQYARTCMRMAHTYESMFVTCVREMFLYCDYRHCHHHYSAGVCRRH